MSLAEDYTAIANAGDDREAATYDEIVIDEVAIPVRSIQRTDTSRFEGKVVFGDYTVDSDQLMSTWSQSSWVGGMNIANHAEGATDSKFRYARAWTMNSRQMALPLHVESVTLGYTSSVDNAADMIVALLPAIASGSGLPYMPWLWDGQATIPLGARWETIWAACGRQLSAIDATTLAVTNIGDMDFIPVNQGAWYDDGSGTMVLWIPYAHHGIQTYDPNTDTFGTTDGTIEPVALLRFDTRLYALTIDGRLRYRTPAGAWDAGTSLDMVLPEEEIPRGLVSFFDRGGNPAVTILTNKQAWVFQDDAEAIVPLGLRYPFSRRSAEASAVWRDDGLYATHGLGINRMSSAGVRTAMGLDRDEGYQVATLVNDSGGTMPDTPAIWAMTDSENFLAAAVNSYQAADTTCRHDLLAWNEGGWHHLGRATTLADTDGVLVPNGLLVADTLDGYMLVMGEKGSNLQTPDSPGQLYVMRIPEDFHAPLADYVDQPVTFASSGVFYSGWFDAAMQNFEKAWSQVEVYMRDPDDGSAAPPGTVTVHYRTDLDPDTWVELGTATAYGQNILPFGLDGGGFSHGLVSRKIELRYTIEHTDHGVSSEVSDTPVIEATVLKFQKIAQYGSAWLVHVPLSDFDTYKGLGPTEIDDYLHRLTMEGSDHGPFAELLHGRGEDGEPERHRIRAAQWQRSEIAGDAPYGDGVLNLVTVPIQEVG